MSRISLIIPVYNASEYLHYCLDSVVAQNYQKYELILVDDGSTDNSGTLCDEFAKLKHHFFTKVIHKTNGGVSSARNAGIKVAEGKYIVFADCDDYLEPDYLSALIGTRDDYPNAGHIWCGFQLVKGYQRENAKSYFLKEDAETTIYDRSDYMTLYSNWMTQGPYCKLFDAAVLKTIRFNENLSLGEDILFNLDYVDKIDSTQIVFVNRVLYNYIQVSDHSLYSKYRNNLYEINCMIDQAVKERIIRWKLPEQAWKEFYSQVYYHAVNTMENTFHKENRKSFWKKFAMNNELLKNELFQEALQYDALYINPVLKTALRSQQYIWVFIFNAIDKTRRIILKSSLKKTVKELK